MHLAELILALFMTRERAGAAVGDWLEEVPQRGRTWFWLRVFRTAASLLWHDLTAEPVFLAGLGFRGLLVQLGLFLLAFLAFALLAVPIGLFLPTWASRCIGVLGMAVVCFQTGRWIARRARGREMAACATFLIVQTLVMQIAGEALIGGAFGRYLETNPSNVPDPHITTASTILSNLLAATSLFAGAARVTYRRRSTGA